MYLFFNVILILAMIYAFDMVLLICRWIKSLHPARKRVGRWTVEEDKRLKVAVILFGPKTWQKIAQFVLGRTQVQCRERWVNCLDPSLNLEEWTEEEDCKLKAAIAEYGHCWSKVAASVPPRTDSQCRRRWKGLLPHEVPVAQAARKIQKAALISNFVDRKAERPALDHCDFVSIPRTNSIPGPDGKHIGNEKKSRGRAKSKKTKDVSSCDAAPKKIRSKRSRTEAETCHAENSRITNYDENIGNCGKDGNVLWKRKRAPNMQLNSKQGTNIAPDNQDIPLLPEDSTILTITGGDDNIENYGEDTIVLRKKKMAPNRRSKKNQCTNPAPGNQDVPLFPEDSSNVRITDGNDNIENCGEDGTVLRKKKRAPQKRLKRNPCANTVPGNQDIPLLLEDSTNIRITNGDDNFENGDEDGTISGKKKKAPQKRQRRNQCANPLSPEDSTNLTISNGDDNIENCGEDGTISGENKRAPQKRLKRNQCANPVPGNQDIPILSEASKNIRVTDGEANTDTFDEDDSVSSAKKNDNSNEEEMPRSNSKRKACIDEAVQDSQDLFTTS